MEKEKKPRGRPPLPPDEKEKRRIETNKRINEHHKKTGYAAQRKYDENHEGEIIPLRVFLRPEFKAVLDELSTQTGMSPAKILLTAAEEKYNISLMREVDRKDE